MKYLFLLLPLNKSSLLLWSYYGIKGVTNNNHIQILKSHQKSYWLTIPNHSRKVLPQKKKQYSSQSFFPRYPLPLTFDILLYSLYRDYLLQYNLWVYLQQIIKITHSLDRTTLIRKPNLHYLKIFKQQLSLL